MTLWEVKQEWCPHNLLIIKTHWRLRLDGFKLQLGLYSDIRREKRKGREWCNYIIISKIKDYLKKNWLKYKIHLEKSYLKVHGFAFIVKHEFHVPFTETELMTGDLLILQAHSSAPGRWPMGPKCMSFYLPLIYWWAISETLLKTSGSLHCKSTERQHYFTWNLKGEAFYPLQVICSKLMKSVKGWTSLSSRGSSSETPARNRSILALVSTKLKPIFALPL